MRRSAKIVAITLMVLALILQVVVTKSYIAPTHEVDGIWTVDTWSADGKVRPPLVTDADRWRKVILDSEFAQIRTMTDDRTHLRAEISATERVIRVTGDDTVETWHYARPAADQLVIDGRFRGRQLHVTLVREPEPLLVTRGFHWVQEKPFNR
jgi:hypothetical protein